MGDVEIHPIQLPRDAVRFVKTWWPIYADDPHWVPPLIPERKVFFDPDRNPYFAKADVRCFIARRDGRDVGTVAATVDAELQTTEPGVGLFGFFEFVDDREVAAALLDAATEFLGSRGMSVARGPFNFNINHEFGLLVDGFDTDPCVANPHNRDYYAATYESLGLTGVMDWYAYWIDMDSTPPLVEKLARRVEGRVDGLEVRTVDMARFSQEVELFREIYNDAWENNWGHIKLSDAEFGFIADNLRQIIDPDLCFVASVHGDVAAISLTLPDFNQVAKKMKGHLLPFGWYHAVFGRRNIDALRIFILGVKHRYQRLGLGAPLYARTWDAARRRNVRGAEASLILENNHRMRGAIEKMGGRIYKTYRSYEIPLSPPGS